MNELIQFQYFQYQDVSLKEACWVDRKPWFTEQAIGEWLEVKHPNRYVAKIVERNPHILPFRTFVSLTKVEGSREVTRELPVYDPIGLQLIVMESHQPKAIAYKIAVAHLVAAYMRGEVVPASVRRIPEPPTLEGLAIVAPYTRGKGKAIDALCLEYQRCRSTINKYIKNVREGKPIKQVKEPNKPFYIHKKHRSQYEQVLALRAEGVRVKDIAKRLNVPVATVYRWIGNII